MQGMQWNSKFQTISRVMVHPYLHRQLWHGQHSPSKLLQEHMHHKLVVHVQASAPWPPGLVSVSKDPKEQPQRRCNANPKP